MYAQSTYGKVALSSDIRKISRETIINEYKKFVKPKHARLTISGKISRENLLNTIQKYFGNWKKSKDAGLCRGAYHFFIGSRDGRMQAENFIDNVKLETGDLPPVLDAEQLNGAKPEQFKKDVQKWLEIIEAYYHVKPIIYTNVEFYNRCLGSQFDDFPLWVSNYYQPDQPHIARGWVFWQHSNEGRVNGIISKVDFNVFNGDSVAFRSLLIR